MLYKVKDIEECFEFFETSPYKIVKMELDAKLEKSSIGNRILFVFDNTKFPRLEIRFELDKTDKYLLLKNKIEICLKNFRLNYRLLSKIPLTAVGVGAVFGLLCSFTKSNNIVFNKNIQELICVIFFVIIMAAMYIGFTPLINIKRNLFPAFEFRIGQNCKIEDKYMMIRNILMGSIGGGILIGLITNYIYEYLL